MTVINRQRRMLKRSLYLYRRVSGFCYRKLDFQGPLFCGNVNTSGLSLRKRLPGPRADDGERAVHTAGVRWYPSGGASDREKDERLQTFTEVPTVRGSVGCGVTHSVTG